MKKRIKGLLFLMMLAVVFGLAWNQEKISAADNADEIVAKAVDEMKKAKSISFSMESIMEYTDDKYGTEHYSHIELTVFSGKNVDYGIGFEENDGYLDEYIYYYEASKRYFRYGGETEFQVYDTSSLDGGNYSIKVTLEDVLSHLKKIKISKTTKKNYIITAKPADKDLGYSRISLLINRKSGRISKIKYTAARVENNYYLDTDLTYTITRGSEVYTGISYGDLALKIPEEVKNSASDSEPAGQKIIYEKVFPSWNPDSSSLKELVDFVIDSTDKNSPGYIEPEDRIAVFDMDGTILCEKAPVYLDYCLTMYRVLDDPDYEATEDEKNAMQQIRDHAYSEGKTFKPEGLKKDDIVASAFAGMTPEEFRSYVVKFADNTDAVGFSGMTYGESFYKPMIEVINFLRNYGYDIWMVSACEREVVRALVERYGIPYDHVVATDVPYVASGKGDEAADAYNMGKDEKILLGAPLDEVECGKSGKSAAIAREIGKYPVLAFGNSSGDYSMLNYAEGNPKHTGMGFFIVCDDTEREYGSEEKAAEYYEEVEKRGWTPFSMANDWKTIYGDSVEKTGLPGTEEAAQEAA